MDATQGRTKGTGIIDCLDFVEERFGKEALAELSEQAARETIGLPLDSISVAQWYPSAAYVRLLEWITDRFLDADSKRCAEIGAFGVGRDFHGVYRAFLTVARPSFLLRLAQRIWTQYQSSGRLRVLEQSDAHCVIEIDGYSDPSVHQWYATVGGTLRALELMGAKDLSFQTLIGIGDGSARFVYRCDWR